MASKKLYFRYSLFGIFAILIVVFDQLTKLFIENNFVTGQTKEIIPKILNFTYILNEGAAFGIMQGRKIAFIIITIAVFVAAFFCFKKYKPSSILALLSASFILSGAVGNLIDRVRFGYVRDFIDVAFMNFPVFNIADCAICVGAFLLILYALFDIGRAK